MGNTKVNSIELAIFFLSILFLAVSLIEIYQVYQPPERDLFVIGYSLILVTLFVILLSDDARVYIFSTTVQILFVFMLLYKLPVRFGTLEIVLIIVCLINLCLHVTPRLSVPLSLFIIAMPFVIFFLSGAVPRGTRFTPYLLRRCFYALILEFSFALLFQGLIIYRERLVSCRNRLDRSMAAIENLEAANESFISHITDIKQESAEEERNRITRELHDSLGYAMTNIVMMMNATTYLDDKEKLLEYCRMTKNLASKTMDETRSTLYQLRRIGFTMGANPLESINNLCREFERFTNVHTEFNSGNMPDSLPEGIYQIIFRIIQVGFINALKHGKTDHIRVLFWLTPEELIMTLWNNRKSRVEDQNLFLKNEGIGLSGIRERLANINGCLMKRSLESGFELIITIPREELKIE